MIKDGYDDIQRHKQDRYLNNKKTQRVNADGKLQEIPWQDVMTGNLIMVIQYKYHSSPRSLHTGVFKSML